MKSRVVFIICFLNIFVSYGQQVFNQWVKSIGDYFYDDCGYSVKTDASGNVYTTGYFDGSAYFDANTFLYAPAGQTDIFISKMDAIGNLVWAKSIGSTGSDIGYSLAVDGSGNVYVTGIFSGTVDFDPGSGVSNLTATGNGDIFVCKLDASGNFVWAKNMGGTSNEHSNSIVLDGTGNIYITGKFSGTADFDPGFAAANLTSAGSDDIFVCKLDASGNYIWAKKMGSNSADNGNAIAIDKDGNSYTVGAFSGVCDFDPSTSKAEITSNGSTDIFICKLDASGNYVWAKAFGSSSTSLNDVGYSIAIDASGHVITTGYFGNTVDFDPGSGTSNLTSAGSYDVFVSKLDGSGNFVWAKSMGGATTEYAYSVALDSDNNIYTTGAFSTTADFNPGTGVNNITSSGNNNIFISKLDASGNYVNVTRMGGNDLAYGLSIAVDASYNFIVTGRFTQNAYFGSSYKSTSGYNNIFIVKMGQCINPIDVSTTVNGNTLTANLNGATSYEWVSFYNNQIWHSGSFSNTQSFTPSSSGIYGVLITVGACVDTSAWIDFKYIVSGIDDISELDNGMSIYPNPSKGEYKIDLTKDAEVILSDELGRIIWNNHLTRGTHSLYLEKEKNGVYILRVRTEQGETVRKLMLYR